MLLFGCRASHEHLVCVLAGDTSQLPASAEAARVRQVCGSSPHMLLTQFRDAMVRLAAIKYPSLPRPEALSRRRYSR